MNRFAVSSSRPSLPALEVILASTVLSAPAFGGAITIQDTTPDPTRTGAIVQNSASFTVTQPSTNSLKLFGTALITNNGTNTGDGTFRIPLSGTFTAAPNERLFSTYQFDATRSGSSTGTVTYAVTGTGTASVLGVPVTLSASSSGTVASGSHTYVGSSQSDANATPLTLNGNYTAYLEITWVDGTAGDTLAINIPNNSIDFLISTVPEPASPLLLGLGAMLVSRRRTRS